MLFDEWFDEIIRKHNDRVRTYWHVRPQTVSCRVRNKLKNNAMQFRTNIILYLYNMNLNEVQQKEMEMNRADYKLVQDKFGFTEINNEIALINMRKETATMEDHELLARLDDRLVKCHQQQFKLTQAIQNVSVIDLLGLHNVVATKLPGYYKELFFLKCNLHDVNPAVRLRILYHVKSRSSLQDIELEFEDYKEEIVYLLQELIKDHWYFKKS